jgi:uncharacterized protein YndB with AHSA1/START domain
MTLQHLDPDAVRDRAMTITRTYDAPRALVFEAFTRPEHVGHWWGPNGFTITTASMNAEVGGEWRFVMHGPDGTDWPNVIRYLAVDRPERLVYDHGADDGPAHFRVTITFEDADGATRVTMQSLFPTAAALEGVKAFGAEELGQQTFARLDGYLRTL